MSNETIKPHFCSEPCDSCGARPTIMMYHNGSPALAQCKVCMPKLHEDTTRADIDDWLNGGNTLAFERPW